MAKVLVLNDLTETLQAYVQSGNLNFLMGSGASLPAIDLAGDIEEKIDGLINSDKEDKANILALDFIEDLESQNNSISMGLLEKDSAESQTLDNYFNFLTVLDELLFERKNYLLPRQANIFTTNYDLLIEYAAIRLRSLILIDGFDRTSTLDGAFRFAPEHFLDRTYRSGAIYTRQSEMPTVNLFKLHGSLNWSRLDSEITNLQELPAPLDKELRDISSEVTAALSKRAIILPNLRKFGSTLMDRIYYDLLRFFANSIEKENAVVIVFGFSFSDEHILDVTRRALRNPTSQLIIFAYDEEAVESYKKKFESHRNTLIVSPCEDGIIDFGKFTDTIKKVIPNRYNSNE